MRVGPIGAGNMARAIARGWEMTSPGGGTARGLAALERAGVRTAFQDAIDAVVGWSRE